MEERLRYLFGRYFDNSCSRQELEEFFMCVQKAKHDDVLRQLIKKAYDEHKEHKINTTFVNEEGRLILTQHGEIEMDFSSVTKNKRSKLLTLLSLAASIVVVVVVAWLAVVVTNGSNKKTNAVSSTKRATNRSESKFILLEDSTQVWLNAASSLEFPDQFAANKREVFLSGEAFFDVKHAEEIPFIIHTGNVSTTVLGTAFNIKAYPGQQNITISVSRGKVKVSRADGWITTLTKGQQVKVKKDGREVTEKKIAPEGIASWQQGNIVYEDETLDDIISDMQRIYNVNIRINNKSIQDLTISTSFKREIGIEQALQVLCKLTDTELKEADGVYLIQ
jgi:ferric-dicitrate binding protein FerR (iron transport regulator)